MDSFSSLGYFFLCNQNSLIQLLLSLQGQGSASRFVGSEMRIRREEAWHSRGQGLVSRRNGTVWDISVPIDGHLCAKHSRPFLILQISVLRAGDLFNPGNSLKIRIK